MVYMMAVVPVHDPEPLQYWIGGDVNKIRAIDPTPDDGGGISPQSGGRPVHTEFYPTKVRWGGGKRKIPDFTFSYRISVSERAKALIEQFEPGVHQFIPVDYVNGKGEVIEKRYFLQVCNRIDSVDEEHTTFVKETRINQFGNQYTTWWSAKNLIRWGSGNVIPSHITTETPPKYVFNAAQIGKCQLWHDKYIPEFVMPWMSDALGEAMIAAKLTGVDPRRQETV